MSELLPCPFCGGSAMIIVDHAGTHNFQIVGCHTLSRCPRPKTTCYVQNDGSIDYSAWNRRTPHPVADASPAVGGAVPDGYDAGRWNEMERRLAAKHNAAAPTAQRAMSGEQRNDALEEAARIIEQNQIADNGGSGKYLRPRHEGSIDGLFYAAAIRELKHPTSPEGSDSGKVANELAAFERWISDDGSAPEVIAKHKNGSYKNRSTTGAWTVWQARATAQPLTSESGPSGQDECEYCKAVANLELADGVPDSNLYVLRYKSRMGGESFLTTNVPTKMQHKYLLASDVEAEIATLRDQIARMPKRLDHDETLYAEGYNACCALIRAIAPTSTQGGEA